MEERKSDSFDQRFRSDEYEDESMNSDEPLHSIMIRDYENDEKVYDFFHIYTSQASLKDPISVTIHSTYFSTFKDYLKEEQKDNINVYKQSKKLVLLPIYSQKLKPKQYSVPKSMTPIFDDHDDTLHIYLCDIEPVIPRIEDIPDLTFHLYCQFFITELDSLVSQEGESNKIMKIIIQELFENHLYD